MSLDEKQCTPCEEGGDPMESDEIDDYLDKIDPDWQSRSDKKIFRQFDFMDFEDALDFVNEVGEIAEEEGHHPDIHLKNYNEIVIEIWTHAVGELTENDFILASKIDKLDN